MVRLCGSINLRYYTAKLEGYNSRCLLISLPIRRRCTTVLLCTRKTIKWFDGDCCCIVIHGHRGRVESKGRSTRTLYSEANSVATPQLAVPLQSVLRTRPSFSSHPVILPNASILWIRSVAIVPRGSKTRQSPPSPTQGVETEDY